MVQRLKVLVTVSDDLRSIARIHVVERADFESCPLTSAPVPHTWPHRIDKYLKCLHCLCALL